MTGQTSTGVNETKPSRRNATDRAGLTRWVVVVALLVFVELMAFAGRYGYHGDEMYFIVAGGHPAFGYPDQPPLVPLVIWSMHTLFASLYLVRLPSALAAATIVLVAALTARDAGGGRRAQVIAAVVTGVSAISLATGHFVTTTTFDVLSTSVLGWLAVRALVRHDPRPLVWAGVVVGVGFEAKPNIGFVATLVVVAFAIVGPRWVLRSRQLWTGIALAVALAAPYVIWQARHGFPQFTVASNVAGSAESGRIGFIPFQIVMVSPFLVPVWIAGLVAAWRRPELRWVPALYGLVALGYLVGNGKAYYLASLYPMVIGIGALPTAAWTLRGRWRPLRRGLLVTAVVLSGLLGAVVALPLLPERKLPGSGTIALNPDLGQQVGWPQYTDTVAAAWHALPPATQDHAVIFTFSYAEAAAIDVLGGPAGLPHAYSDHNGFSLWGPPPADRTTTIVIGYDPPPEYFTGCAVVGRVSNPYGLHNNEWGVPVTLCTGLTVPWSQLWPRLRHYQ